MSEVKNIKFNEKFDREYILATLFGIISFYMVGVYGKIPTGIELVFIYMQYVILVYLAGRFGPVCGMLTGFFGHTMIDRVAGDRIWWNYVLGSVLLGGLIGYVTKIKGISLTKPEKRDRAKFAVINIACQIPVWWIVVPVLEIIMYKTSAGLAFQKGMLICANNILTSVILCDLIIYSEDHIIFRKIFALFGVTNSLVLLSYGNYGFGSIIVYVCAILVSLIVFLKNDFDKVTKNGVGKWVKIVIYLAGSLFLVSFAFLHIAAQISKPTGDEKCMIILGAGLQGDKPSKILQYRLDKAYEYIKENPDIVVITSGGQGADEIISEGEAMRNYLIEKGCKGDNIYAECTSTTTEENFANSYEIMKELGMDKDTRTVFVTNDFHCFRAGQYAKYAGFTDMHPLAAKTPAFLIMNSYFREIFSLVKYTFKLI